MGGTDAMGRCPRVGKHGRERHDGNRYEAALAPSISASISSSVSVWSDRLA